MEYSLEYYLNYWGPFLISLALMLLLIKYTNRKRSLERKELIEINRLALEKLTEIKTLLEDRKP